MIASHPVHAWLWPTEQAPTDLESRFSHWLSEDERARCERLRIDRVRFEYVMTRVLCRQALSLMEPSVTPAQWTFVRNDHGKPEVSGPIGAGSLRFNVSNTFGLVACAITRDHDVGIDVECRERDSDALAIADRYFSVSEVAALRALPSERQTQRFFELWTLKEAYIKARGLGLAIPLGQFSFLLDQRTDTDADIGIAFDAELQDDPAAWSFAMRSPSERHQLAVALKAGSAAMALNLATFVCP